ncbi:PepSY domain-containing protein [Microbispora sp. NPDC088329]|uniref:PepSY domain-containing protein n=1 Tax=Microbispora sp. NPDC088329 TaxID=3154869 RepID=UPI00343B8685
MGKTTKIALAAATTLAALTAGGTAVSSASVAAPASSAHAAASTSAVSASTAITRSQAIAIAKRRVPGARVATVEREWEHGHRVWKVELHKGHREYDVYVSVANGRIVKFRVKNDDRRHDDRGHDDRGHDGRGHGRGHDD